VKFSPTKVSVLLKFNFHFSISCTEAWPTVPGFLFLCFLLSGSDLFAQKWGGKFQFEKSIRSLPVQNRLKVIGSNKIQTKNISIGCWGLNPAVRHNLMILMRPAVLFCRKFWVSSSFGESMGVQWNPISTSSRIVLLKDLKFRDIFRKKSNRNFQKSRSDFFPLDGDLLEINRSAFNSNYIRNTP
jgi:hypothetical protein